MDPLGGGGQVRVREIGEIQGDEGRDTAGERLVGRFKSSLAGGQRLDVGRVGDPPMNLERLSRPDRADFGRRAAAYGENGIDAWRAGAAELVPGFAARIDGSRDGVLGQGFERNGVDPAGGLAACRERADAIAAQMIE